ncbi:hypothetical protein HYX05_00485 [Candidatus Woesearchaeota archaeon]|nr:hypothetical protein [Candidatus Woesearchaeota archaeon]
MLLRLINWRYEKAKKAFDKAIGEALKCAKSGDVQKATTFVDEAQHLSSQYGLGFNLTEADFIKKTARKNVLPARQIGLERDLDSARYWASEGHVDTAIKYINGARHYASLVGAEREGELAAITKEAYSKGAEKRLYWASRNLQGEYPLPFDALRDIKRARLYASRAGLDIKERARQLRREAAVKGVEVYLRLAREDAEIGSFIQFNISLRRARRFAQLSGADISQQIQEIKPVAYANRAKIDMKIAQDYRENGYINRATLWEEMAKQLAVTAEAAQKRVNGSGATIDDAVIF